MCAPSLHAKNPPLTTCARRSDEDARAVPAIAAGDCPRVASVDRRHLDSTTPSARIPLLTIAVRHSRSADIDPLRCRRPSGRLKGLRHENPARHETPEHQHQATKPTRCPSGAIIALSISHLCHAFRWTGCRGHVSSDLTGGLGFPYASCPRVENHVAVVLDAEPVDALAVGAARPDDIAALLQDEVAVVLKGEDELAGGGRQALPTVKALACR